MAHSVKEFYMRQAFNLPDAQAGEAPELQPPPGLDLRGKTPAQWLDDMRQHARKYVEFVRTLVQDIPDLVIVEEQRVDVRSIHPALFGTADTLLWSPSRRLLIVIDYKYGFFYVEIGTVDDTNPQLAGYAVAATEALQQQPLVIVLVVYQPRAPLREPIQHLVIKDPQAWLAVERTKLAREALRTEDPNEQRNPGGHCKYCKAKARCPEAVHAPLQVALAVAAGARDMLAIPDDELVALFSARKAFESFWEDVEERIKRLASSGHPRLMVQQSQGRQRWADKAQTVPALLGLGRLDLLQPVAISDVAGELPAEILASLTTRGSPSHSIKVVDAPELKAVAQLFQKYAR